MKRKSWFRRSKVEPPALPDRATEIANEVDDVERLRPLQFSPNRIATLYVSNSDRNLYLAAMSQLDRGPPALPLWSEPAPSLPPFPPNQYGQPATDWNPPATQPVTSTIGPGLQIRDEFRAVPPRSTTHAILSLNPPSGMRFTGFTKSTLLAVDEVVCEKWPIGVRRSSESVDGLKARGGTGEGLTWRVELNGKAWTRKGHQELEWVKSIDVPDLQLDSAASGGPHSPRHTRMDARGQLAGFWFKGELS